jgi:hypothetical protein
LDLFPNPYLFPQFLNPFNFVYKKGVIYLIFSRKSCIFASVKNYINMKQKIILNPEEIINEYKGGVGVEALALNIMLVN